MSDEFPPLVVLGCGFTGLVAARIALARRRRVIATTRDPARAAALSREGIEAWASPVITAEFIRERVTADAHVLATIPPDGETDARVTGALPATCRSVYVSTTGVYGDRTGRIDSQTPVEPSTEKAIARLEAERLWRARGAVVLRAAGIYGPGRGLHRRVAEGTFKVTEGGHNVVSRIHVEDLATLCLAALERGVRGATFPVADDAPVPQIEVVRWLVARLGVAMPGSVRASEAAETLRHDRSIDGRDAQAALGVTLRYPTWREGFEACLVADGIIA